MLAARPDAQTGWESVFRLLRGKTHPATPGRPQPFLDRADRLALLLTSLDEAFFNGPCPARSITVASTSDGLRIRSPESDVVPDVLRLKALRLPSFADSRFRLLSTLVSGADRARDDNPGFRSLETVFTQAGFDVTHLDDGWRSTAATPSPRSRRRQPRGRPPGGHDGIGLRGSRPVR